MATRNSVLKILQNNSGRYISGEELSNQLNISRTAVWKAINTLRNEGYSINAVTNKGYILMRDEPVITEEALREYLPSRYSTGKLAIYDTVDSTNIRAKQLALEKAAHGTVVLAMQQTAGRGRLGRSFFSPREGIYLSIIIKPDFDLSKSILVTSAAAVAVAEAIEEICGQESKIKWVNDIYVNNKKVCGILTEGITDFESGQIEYLVIGIGINTNIRDFPEDLLDIVGAVEGDYSKAALAASVITRVLDLTASIDSRTFIDAYRKRSLVTGRDIKVYKGKYRISPDDDIPAIPAKVLGIDDDGGLQVMYADGTRETLSTGEISIRL